MAVYLMQECNNNLPQREQSLLKLVHVLGTLFQSLPTSSLTVTLTLTALMQSFVAQHFTHARFDSLSSEIKALKLACEEVTQKIHDEKLQPLHEPWEEPPDDYRTIPIIPTAKDINGDQTPFLRKNLVNGHYRDSYHYLDVQFRLCREDFVGPLREGIRERLQEGGNPQGKIYQGIRVYTGVRILEPHCSRTGIIHDVSFDASHLENVNWETSKRLVYGSLLCFSKDGFRTAIFGTVAKRTVRSVKRGIIQIGFEEMGQTLGVNPYEIYEMVEPSAYFEAYRYILEGLKKVRETTLPFYKYLVGACPDGTVRPPGYLTRNTCYSFSCMLDAGDRALSPGDVDSKVARQVKVLDHASWPTAEELQLDDSQYSALQNALTKEFALIQGPPGTGKTFIGLKIAEVLLSSRTVWYRGEFLILVVCLTNHALDQFLEGILRSGAVDSKHLIRIGSRSSSTELAECMLAEKRKRLREENKELKIRTPIWMNLRDIRGKMKAVARGIEAVSKKLQLLRTGIIDEVHLRPFMTPAQRESLMSRSPTQAGTKSCMVAWLLGNVMITPPEEVVGESTRGLDALDGDFDEDEKTTTDEKDEFTLLRQEVGMYASRAVSEVAFQAGAPGVNARGADTEQEWTTVRNRKEASTTMKKSLQRAEPMSAEQAEGVQNVWELTEMDRWKLYLFWISRYTAEKSYHLEVLKTQYNELANRRKMSEEEENFEIISQSRVIGVTTTGAAKHREILQRVRPKIVIVEEAAEVFEAHIVTSLSESCRHLILIGDHQQLRPNPTMYKLAKDYYLDISLFERIVKAGVSCNRLEVQHRMRPEIARLIVPHVYKDLQNSDSVSRYDHIAGIEEDVFFIKHNKEEDNEEDTRSHSNIHEAEYLVALYRYLLQQGYSSSQITILTTYTGQMTTVQQTMKRNDVRGQVTPVDNYQGEENDIILLSLVRSNAQGEVGFLKVENRVCVALSRARKGFYAIGNMTLLAENSPLWKRILGDFTKQNRVAEALCLTCQNHPDTVTFAKCARDFDSVPDGGCTRPCGARLPCGHECTKKCHPTDPWHQEYKCMKTCVRTCAQGHACTHFCYQDCGPCFTMVETSMPVCQHVIEIPCSADLTNVDCTYGVRKRLPCGHSLLLGCSDDPSEYSCSELVEKYCDRGHKTKVPCDESVDIDCMQSVVLRCQYDQLHQYEVPCSKAGAACPETCSKPLPCKHTCQGRCTPGCKEKCYEPCSTICGHGRCEQPCWFPCGFCLRPCTWKCRHLECTNECFEPCNREPCDEPCQIIQLCGHQCPGLCGEPCPPQCRLCHPDVYESLELKFGSTFSQGSRFVLLQPCYHIMEVERMDQIMNGQGFDSYPRPVHVFCCPVCNAAVSYCPRYGNKLKRAQKELRAIKGAPAALPEESLNQTGQAAKMYLEELGEDRKRLITTNLSDETWVETNGTYLQRIIGCCNILSKIKFPNSTSVRDRVQAARKTLAKCLPGKDMGQLIEATENLKTAYVENSVCRIMSFSEQTRKELRGLLEQIERIKLKAWTAKLVQGEGTILGALPPTLAKMTRDLQQRFEDEDLQAQLHEFFNFDIWVFTSQKHSHTWMTCHKGHVYRARAFQQAPRQHCPSCQEDDVLEDGRDKQE